MKKEGFIDSNFVNIKFLNKLIDGWVSVLEVFIQHEGLPVESSHILFHIKPPQVVLQLFQLKVNAALVIRHNWDPILHLEIVRIGSIVNQNHFRQLPIYYPQVLYINPLRWHETMLTVKTMGDVLPSRIQHVKNSISVTWLTCGKYYDFKLFV